MLLEKNPLDVAARQKVTRDNAGMVFIWPFRLETWEQDSLSADFGTIFLSKELFVLSPLPEIRQYPQVKSALTATVRVGHEQGCRCLTIVLGFIFVAGKDNCPHIVATKTTPKYTVDYRAKEMHLVINRECMEPWSSLCMHNFDEMCAKLCAHGR